MISQRLGPEFTSIEVIVPVIHDFNSLINLLEIRKSNKQAPRCKILHEISSQLGQSSVIDHGPLNSLENELLIRHANSFIKKLQDQLQTCNQSSLTAEAFKSQAQHILTLIAFDTTSTMSSPLQTQLQAQLSEHLFTTLLSILSSHQTSILSLLSSDHYKPDKSDL